MADIEDQVGGGIAALQARAAKADARGAAISGGNTDATETVEEAAKQPVKKTAKKRAAKKAAKQSTKQQKQTVDESQEAGQSNDKDEPEDQQAGTEADERDEEDVEEIVGENQPTNVGRDNPTSSSSAAPSIFGKDRRANLHGRKLHPRQESDQKNLTMRVFLINTVVDLADEVGLSTQPGKVFDFLVEHALRDVAPEMLKRNYDERCEDIGIPSDWQ